MPVSRADGEQAVFGARVAQRAQAVAIEAGDSPAAVEHGERRGAVPRLHHRVAIGVERLVLVASSCATSPTLRE